MDNSLDINNSMPMNRRKYLSVMERRGEALDIVDSNLRSVNYYMKYGIPTVVDLVPYHSPSGNFDAPTNLSSFRTNTGQPLINAIDKLTHIEDFVKRVIGLFEKLNAQQRQVVYDAYFSGKPKREYGRNFSNIKESALELIAIYDTSIDYSQEDYHFFHSYKLQESKSARKIYRFYLHEIVDMYLADKEQLKDLLIRLPDREKSAFLQYVDMYKTDTLWPFGKREYRFLKRAVLTMAYWHKDIEIDSSYFEKAISEDTGSGGRSYLKKIGFIA